MKKIILLSFLLLQTIIYSQDNPFGGSPVLGVTPINRINDGTASKMVETTEPIATARTAGTPTGNSGEVGVTEGQLEVSLTGGATYNIPIAVPPGINGVVPQVSLVYNSQGGNGIAGYGWNISGVSTISRIPSTMFHDGVIDAVDFDNLDRFAFDGQRLILKTGTYGGDGAVYETENFSNLKITSYGVSTFGANYGPAYFVVQYPDGSKAEYGNSSNSFSKTDWGINYWENPQGVRISYTYNNQYNYSSISISNIKYGSTFTNTAVNEIQFVYNIRIRPEQIYVGGLSIVMGNILEEIKVVSNGIGLRNYVLENVTTSLYYQRLTKITEKSGDNTKSYNPTVFTYENTPETMTYLPTVTADLSVGNISLSNAATVSGDFNGDGSMDFILYPTTGPEAKKKYWLFDELNNPFATLGWTHNVGAFEEIFPISWLTWNEKLLPQQGWCVVKQNASTNVTSFQGYSAGITYPIYPQDLKEYVFPKFSMSYYYNDYCANCPGCDPLSTNPAPIDGGGGINNTNQSEPILQTIERDVPKMYISGDFNGDGLTDAVTIEKSISFYVPYDPCTGYTYTQQGGKTYFVNLDRRLTANFVNEAGYLQTQDNSKILVADFDGDGKDDIYVFNSGNVKIYTLNDAKQFVNLYNSPYDTDIVTSRTILLGDYNGDGKIDFMIPRGYGRYYYKFTATATGFFKEPISGPSYLANTADDTYHLINNDFNNDGKTDIAFVATFKNSQNVRGVITVQMCKNMGNAFVAQPNVNSPMVEDIQAYPIPIFLNSNQPNQSLELAFISGQKIHRFQSNKDFGREKLLKSITTGNGVNENITYSPLVASQNYYDDVYMARAGNELYPNIDIAIAPTFKVVSKVEKQSSTTYTRQLFKYYGAVSNLSGQGFLGFQGVMRTNWHNDNFPVISTISKQDITRRGAVTENYTFTGLGYASMSCPTSFISKSIMTYEHELSATKVFKIKNTGSTSFDGVNDTSSETTTQYDIYNNPTLSTTLTKASGALEQTQTVAVDYLPLPASGTYYVGRPQKKNISVTSHGDTNTSEEQYTFNANHLLSEIKKKGHLTNFITENNDYDTFGNITKKTISATGLTPRVTSYAYDTSGRFLIKSTDIEGLQTQFGYNTSNGWLLSETNPYNLTTQYEYDVWGKKIKTIDYLGKTAITIYAKADSVNTLITSQSDEGSSSIMKLDDLGREIITGSKNIDNTWSYIKTQYDDYSRKISIGEPVSIITAAPTQFTTSKFDTYSRPIESVAPTGKITTISYSGLTTTVNDGTKTVTTVKNSIGNVKSVTDQGGTINYQYYANGNLKQSNFDGTIIPIKYDGWGRKTELTDPSAGTYKYEYNELGELTKEITPKGATTYTLDAVGNLTEKTIVGDLTNSKTTYAYDGTTKLLKETSFQDILESTTTTYKNGYDNKQRLISTIENNPNAIFTHEMGYDDFGRVDFENYNTVHNATGKSSTRLVKNTYKNGSQWQILDGGVNVLWQANTVNARGQLISATLGNGIAIANTYDQYGFSTQTKHEIPGTTPINIMTLNTVFEPKRGNLTSRTNNMFNWNETFKFDSLDRLTEYTNAKGLQETQTYDTKGRITTNSLGTYNYQDPDPTKVYRNTSLDIAPEALAHFANREGIFSDTFDGEQKWGKDKYPASQNFVSYDNYIFRSGRTSLKLNNSTSTDQNVYADSWINIDNAVDTQYTFSAWVYSDNPQSGLLMLMKTANETAFFTSFDNVVTIRTNDWYLLTKTITVPANIKKLRLRLDQNGTGNSWFDDIKIVKTADATAQRELNISYNAFKSPVQIEETGVDKISFTYNDGNSRSNMYYGSMSNDKLLRSYRKHYSADGIMEIKHNTVTGEVEFLTYIGGDGYSAPIVLKSDGLQQKEFLYLHRDYQGTILAITNQTAQVLEKRLFDAWGNIVKVTDGAGNLLNGLTLIDRGYTGHEHLQSVGLIHMNGRLYDSKLHRFLQPDNFVQDPYNTQNYNRYGYVLNNPLMYTDPSGEFWHIVIGAVIGGVVNWATHGFQFNAKGLGYFAIGAVAGALTAIGAGGVSSALAGGSFGAGALGTSAALTATSSFFTGAVIGASGGLVGGFATGVGNSLLDGQNIGKALGNGVRDGLVGSLTGGVIGGVAGGIDAVRDGRRFWDGATVVKQTAVPPYTLQNLQQSSEASCQATCGASIDQSLGGNMTEMDVRNMMPGYDYTGAGAGDKPFWTEFATKTGRHVQSSAISDDFSAKFFNAFNSGGGGVANTRIALSTNNHSLVLQSITKIDITKIGGRVVTKYLLNVMDPAYGAIRSFRPSSFINYFLIR